MRTKTHVNKLHTAVAHKKVLPASRNVKNVNASKAINQLMEFVKKHISIIVSSFVFGILYSLISLINHYNFRTYSLDLGLYTNALYKYAHFQMADNNMIKEHYELLLGGHFDLYLLLFSPSIYLFGSYSLLIIQIIALLFGGVGVYTFFKLKGTKNRFIPILATIYFYSFFGVFGALSFDYHSVVVASSVVPWFFIAIHQNKKWLSGLLFIFILVAQENVSFWAVFICLGLLIEYRSDIKKVYYLAFLSLLSMVYFIVVIYFVIPHFSSEQAYGGFRYSVLGANVQEAFLSLVMHPVDNFIVLFTNHNNSLFGDYVKVEFHLILLASGLLFLFKKPQFLLMLLPVFFQKLFHDNISMWGIGFQYNIEFSPIMAIGIFSVLADIKNLKIVYGLSFLVLAFTVGSSIRTMDNTVFYTNKAQIRFYNAEHYSRNFNVANIHLQLSRIPEHAAVSAQAPFVPHLALRNDIYQFPIVNNANYIVYSLNESSYPLTKEQFDKKLDEILNSGQWEFVYVGEISILKRRNINALSRR